VRRKLVQWIDNLRHLNTRQLTMTTDVVCGDVIAGPKSQMDLLDLEDWRLPRGPMPECKGMVGITDCSAQVLEKSAHWQWESWSKDIRFKMFDGQEAWMCDRGELSMWVMPVSTHGG
jgi:hypothetical protein